MDLLRFLRWAGLVRRMGGEDVVEELVQPLLNAPVHNALRGGHRTLALGRQPQLWIKGGREEGRGGYKRAIAGPNSPGHLHLPLSPV